MSGKNSTVGYVQGINGAMQLLSALPAGYLTDRQAGSHNSLFCVTMPHLWTCRTRRDTMLKISAVVGTLAGLSLLLTLVLKLPVAAFFCALGLLGFYRGASSPPLESIYADSVPTGSRSGIISAHTLRVTC